MFSFLFRDFFSLVHMKIHSANVLYTQHAREWRNENRFAEHIFSFANDFGGRCFVGWCIFLLPLAVAYAVSNELSTNLHFFSDSRILCFILSERHECIAFIYSVCFASQFLFGFCLLLLSFVRCFFFRCAFFQLILLRSTLSVRVDLFITTLALRISKHTF